MQGEYLLQALLLRQHLSRHSLLFFTLRFWLIVYLILCTSFLFACLYDPKNYFLSLCIFVQRFTLVKQRRKKNICIEQSTMLCEKKELCGNISHTKVKHEAEKWSKYK